MTRKWFALVDGQVTGPYTEDDIQSRANSWNNPLIWGRGQGDWLPPSKWVKNISDLANSPVSKDMQSDRLWRVRVGNEESKPMPQRDLILFLQKQKDLKHVLLWTEGYSDWKEVFQIHKIMDELNISRRAHPRVPIMGSAQLDTSSGSFQTRLLSVSEGGIGVSGTNSIKMGEKLKVILKSPNLPQPIHSTVEAVFIGSDGYVGMKFIAIDSESKNHVLDYVSKFLDTHVQTN